MSRYMSIYETPHGFLPRRDARAILAEAQNHRCCYCTRVMTDPDDDSSDPLRCTIEHIVPISRGGTNAYDNLAAACSECNSERCAYQDMHAIAFYYARASGQIVTRRERRMQAGAPPIPKRLRKLPPIAAPAMPKVAAYLATQTAKPTKLAMEELAKRFVKSGLSRRQRKQALLALVGHDVPFGHNRLPKTATPTVPIQGASLGSIWPKVA